MDIEPTQADTGSSAGPTRLIDPAFLNRVVQQLAAISEKEPLAAKILDVVEEALAPDLALMFLHKDGKLEFQGLRTRNLGFPRAKEMLNTVGECLCGATARQGRVHFSNDIRRDSRCTRKECKQAGIVSFASLPLIVEDEVIGVLGLGALTRRDFGEQTDILDLLTSILSVNLHRGRLMEEARAHARILETRVDERTSELAETQQRLSALLQLAPVGIFETDENGECLYVNDTMSRYMGRPPAEALGWGWIKALHPEDRDTVVEVWRKTVEERAPLQMDVRLLAPDGRVAWLTVSGEPILDQAGKLTGFTGSALDITRRELAQQAVETMNKRFEDVVFSSNDLVWEADEHGRFTFISPQIRDLLGYEPEERLGRTAFDFMPPGEAERSRPLFQEIAAQRGNFVDIENWTLTKDGRRVCLLTNGVPIWNAQGEYKGYRGVDKDVTRTREAEDKLRESEIRYRRLVEETDNVITQLDGQGLFRFVNRAGERLFGCSGDSCRGRSYLDFVHPEDRRRTRNFLRRRLEQQGESATLENRQLGADGRVSHLSWIINFHYDDKGEPRLLNCIGADVTKQKELEALREDVDRIMRHDLKSPLVGIIGLPQSMLEDANLTEDQREALGHVIGAGYRMLRNVNMSMDLYRIETGSYVFRPEPVDMAAGVYRVLTELRAKAAEKGIRVEKSLPEDCAPAFQGEEALFHSALANLVDNALDASSMGQTVRIAIFAEEGQAVVRVGNPAPVPVEVRKRFFDKYVTSGKYKGTGLGTYSAKLMVQTMGGEIDMRTSEERGTEVTVRFPLFEP